jgi:hypothetical protein
MFAFEIENVYISVRKAAVLLSSVDGVTDIRIRKLFGPNPDTHIQFTYMGKPFMVWEPYGDSSDYWIGPSDETKEVDVSALEGVFKQHRPPFVIKVLGDLVSLKFLTPFKKWFEPSRRS